MGLIMQMSKITRWPFIVVFATLLFVIPEGRAQGPKDAVGWENNDDTARVVWHHVGRALLYPGAGNTYTGQVILYLSQLDGVSDSQSLFRGPPGEATAFLTMRTDTFSLQPLPPNGDVQLFLLSPGTLYVYFNPNPANDWAEPESFSAGYVVARFHRSEAMLISIGAIETHTDSFEFEFSRDFRIGGQTFNFGRLLPHGFTLTNTLSTNPISSASFVALPFGGHAVKVGGR
jgi:hypothetical protein